MLLSSISKGNLYVSIGLYIFDDLGSKHHAGLHHQSVDWTDSICFFVVSETIVSIFNIWCDFKNVGGKMKEKRQDIVDKMMSIAKMKRDSETKIYYLDRIVDEMKSGRLAIFAGAGLSINSGYGDWKSLLKPIGKQLGLNLNMDLTAIAQYYENEFGRDELNCRIINEFGKLPKENDNLNILASLPIKCYWTTNYDSLIEDTLRKEGKIVDVIIEQLQYKYHTPNSDVIVYKMHGDKTLPDKAILTKNDYETYDENRLLFSQRLTMDLITNTFLFIGFSFSDPNLDRIISLVRRNLNGAAPKNHYCFMRSVSINDYVKSEESLSEAAKIQYEQDRNYQELRIRDMRRYGIQTILVEEFDQITLMLNYIRMKFKLDSVFISGGLDTSRKEFDYGKFQKNEKGYALGKAERFIIQLARQLIEEDYKIVTGFGAGIGNFVVSGIYMQGREGEKKIERLNEKIYIQPMIGIDSELDSSIKQKVREQLIDKCGIIVNIFGKTEYVNGDDKDKYRDDGTYLEYSLAKRNEKIVIPVGATGFTSEYIYQLEKENWEDGMNIFEKLGDSSQSVESLVGNIMDAIKFKKKIQEEELKMGLIDNVFTGKEKTVVNTPKQIFISFHYSSGKDRVKTIIKAIEEQEKYIVCQEIEKREPEKIKEWIKEKISETKMTIILFSKGLVESRWVEYEIKESIANQKPFMFLVYEEDGLEKDILNYMDRFNLHSPVHIIHNDDDLKKMTMWIDQIIDYNQA